MIAILGAGHAGRAMAGDLALRGAPVALWNRTAANVAVLRARGGVEVEGEVEGFGRVSLITDDLGEALGDARLVIVCVPAFAHRELAERCAPYLCNRQIVVLNPGRTFGALEFARELAAVDCSAQVVVAEAATNLMTARSTGPAQSYIARIKHAVPVAALQADRTPEVVEALAEWYPQFTPAFSTLETSFSNVGAVIHPAITLLNAARVENDQGRFEFYMEGISPGVARVLAAVDRERRAVAALLGVEVQSLEQWLASAYRATGSDLFEAVRANEGYRGITAPSTLEHRYILEDVPMSLVPIASAGRAFGLNTRAIDALILLAGLIMQTNYWTRGRTLESLGLAGLSREEIRRIAETGVWGG
jgi:opine dehydrogenase